MKTDIRLRTFTAGEVLDAVSTYDEVKRRILSALKRNGYEVDGYVNIYKVLLPGTGACGNDRIIAVFFSNLSDKSLGIPHGWPVNYYATLSLDDILEPPSDRGNRRGNTKGNTKGNRKGEE